MSALSNQIAEKETPPFGSKKNGGAAKLKADFTGSPDVIDFISDSSSVAPATPGACAPILKRSF